MADNVVTFKLTTPDRDRLADQARREGLPSTGALIRKLIDAYRAEVEADPTEIHTTDTEETDMPRPCTGDWNKAAISQPKKGRWSATNPMPANLRVEPAKTTCPRCGADCWADAEGLPKPHLRPSQPGDPEHNGLVPTMTECADA